MSITLADILRIKEERGYSVAKLSEPTKKRDITLKLTKYMEVGVREYWAIDTDRRILIVYLAEEE